MSDDELINEALRLNRRYVTEVVEGLDLCPWAGRALREGRVSRRVILRASDAELEPSLDAMSELAADERVEIGLMIFPRIGLDRLAFERFVARVRERDAERHELGEIPFAMAAFHPDAPADLSDAERLIPFLRRTPDPTIQLVRAAVLEKIRGGPQGTSFIDLSSIDLEALASAEPERPLRERIARTNLETVSRVGVAELERRFLDIQRDRSETYARLGVLGPRER